MSHLSDDDQIPAMRRTRPASLPLHEEEATLPGAPAAPEAAEPELVLSAQAKPASAANWTTGEQPAKLHAPDGPAFSEQSRRMIAAIEEALTSENCSQIDGFGPGRIAAEYQGKFHTIDGLAFADDSEYMRWLRALVETSGSVLDWADIEHRYGGVVNLRDGSRLTLFLPPSATGHATFSLRKHTAKTWAAEDLLDSGMMDQRMLTFLRQCVSAKVNMLIVGTGGSGKTTLLRVLARDFAPSEKVAVVEQVPELGIDKPLSADYQYQPFIERLTLDDNLDRQLYNGLTRLIVGEVHMAGLTKMLECMILSEGSMSTYHALSTEMAGERMKVAMQMENPNLTAATAISYMRQALEVVVVLRKTRTGRRVTQISEIDWRTTGNAETLAGRDIYSWKDSTGRWAADTPPDPNGRVVQKLHEAGIQVNPNAFIEQASLREFEQRFGAR